MARGHGSGRTPLVRHRPQSRGTTAVEILLAGYAALSPEEQDELHAKVSEQRLLRLAEGDSETAIVIRSMRRVAEYLGCEPTVDEYRRAYIELKAAGEDVLEINKVIRFFGSWRRAKEALDLSVDETPLRIEARFRARRVGKVHRYTDATLRETVERCAADIGHVPLVAEFEAWRRRELELAKARGDDDLNLPSDSPYRNRWGSWDGALLAFGYTREEILERLEPGKARSVAGIKRAAAARRSSG